MKAFGDHRRRAEHFIFRPRRKLDVAVVAGGETLVVNPARPMSQISSLRRWMLFMNGFESFIG